VARQHFSKMQARDVYGASIQLGIDPLDQLLGLQGHGDFRDDAMALQHCANHRKDRLDRIPKRHAIGQFFCAQSRQPAATALAG